MENRVISQFEVITQTTQVQGLRLPWRRIERYGPFTTAAGHHHAAPPKGTVLESGEVFVPMTCLLAIAERGRDKESAGADPVSIGYHQSLALLQCGLAERDNRGEYLPTALLFDLLDEEAAYQRAPQSPGGDPLLHEVDNPYTFG